MPTGYTEKLMKEGQSFEEFAMRCARAFGACVLMRDDSLDAKIPEEFKPDDYYKKALADAQARFDELIAMNPKQRKAFGAKERDKAIANYKRALKAENEENARLSAMLDAVSRWAPPTPDHHGMKVFMREQLTISMNDTSYLHDLLAKTQAKSPDQFYDEAVKEAKEQYDYALESLEKETMRAMSRTQWIKALRKSLKANGERKN